MYLNLHHWTDARKGTAHVPVHLFEQLFLAQPSKVSGERTALVSMDDRLHAGPPYG